MRARTESMFTLQLTLHGRATEPTKHESFEDLGETLAKAFDEAGLGLTSRVLSVLLSLMFRDLHTRPTWTWVAESYEIFVARDGV
jgi:hypothetical protein